MAERTSNEYLTPFYTQSTPSTITTSILFLNKLEELSTDPVVLS
jgi:hypothetical protein